MMGIPHTRMLSLTFYSQCLIMVMFTMAPGVNPEAVPPGLTETSLKSFKLTRAVRGGGGGQAADADPAGHSRVKRTLGLDELTFLVDDHNAKRRLEPSSDMEHMRWNSELASMAEEWAKRCVWKHGQPQRNNPPFGYIGQNLYAHKPGLNLTVGMLAWSDDEKVFYDYDTGYCRKDPCGHYTQVVWSSSYEVGCAKHLCPNLVNAFTNAWYLVCNYGPGGNIVGQKPFTIGPPCTQCASGQFWCDNKLCRRDCWASDANCYCGAQCLNGGCVTEDCRCRCQDGYTGPNCAEPCIDTHEYCNANPGWPPSWCQHERWGADVRKGCPRMCEICKPNSGNTFQCPEVDIVTPQYNSAPPTVGTVPGNKGVIIVSSTMQIYWDRLWDSLRPVVTSILTNYCNDHPTECCNGQNVQGDDGFVFDGNNVRQGLGFPRFGKYSGEDSTEMLFYAKSRTVKGQCQFDLSQTVLLEALYASQTQLNQAIGACCDSIFYTLKLGEEPPIPVFTTPTAAPPSNQPIINFQGYRFPIWAIVFIAVLIVGAVIVGLVGGLYWKRRLQKEPHERPSPRRTSLPDITPPIASPEKTVTFERPKSPKKASRSPKSILKKFNNKPDNSNKPEKANKPVKNNKTEKNKKAEKNKDNDKEGIDLAGIVQERITGFHNAAYYNY